jgi:hypothetical protein
MSHQRPIRPISRIGPIHPAPPPHATVYNRRPSIALGNLAPTSLILEVLVLVELLILLQSATSCH